MNTRTSHLPLPRATICPRLYDLRHTHATLLLGAGVHLKIVSERLGHSSIMLTGDTYSHVMPEVEHETALTVEAMLSRQAGQNIPQKNAAIL